MREVCPVLPRQLFIGRTELNAKVGDETLQVERSVGIGNVAFAAA